MLPAANTDLFNPLVPKAHNSECQNLLSPLQIKPLVKSSLRISIYCTLGTNWLSQNCISKLNISKNQLKLFVSFKYG